MNENLKSTEIAGTHIGINVVDLGDIDPNIVPSNTYALTPRIARLAHLAHSGYLGSPEETTRILREEVAYALDSGEVPEYFRELLA